MNQPSQKQWEAFLKAAREVERDYFIEVEKNQKLERELKKLHQEYDLLFKSYTELNGVTKNIQSVKERLEKKISSLKKETERLREVYPLQDLLEVKQAEIKRLKEAMSLVPPDHAERSEIEALVKGHIIERDTIISKLQTAESKFRLHLAKIQATQQEVQESILPISEY